MIEWIVSVEKAEGTSLLDGVRFERPLVRCADCTYFPTPNGIAHVCSYWNRLTNERGYCSNGKEKTDA